MLAMETVRVGWRLFQRDAPWRVVTTTLWVRSVSECFLYTLLGLVAGGAAGADHAFVGAVALTMLFYSLSMATDIPMRDRWDGTYPRLSLARVPPLALFALRSLPHIVHAMLAALVALLIVGTATGRFSITMSMLLASPMLAVGALSCVATGVCIVAPAIGTRLDTITYNFMTALVTICSGAVVPRGRSAIIDAIGSVLPLTHTIAAFRQYLAGGPPWAYLGLELIVAAGWLALAAVLYAVLERRGRKLGRGVFAG